MGWKITYKSLKLKITKAFLVKPIHVFVFHHVSDTRDPLISGEKDWTQTNIFFSNVRKLKTKYHFISLESAYAKIKSNRIRWRYYAVLTTDDGLQTVPYVFPWLEKQGISLTCFINAKYMDGHSYKENDAIRIKREDMLADVNEVIKKQYMSMNQVFSLVSPLISIASHGYEHIDATSLTEAEFKDNIEKCVSIINKHPRYIPFHAYAWGKHSKNTDSILAELGLIPVLVDNQINLNDPSIIHRECIDGIEL